MKQVTHAVYGVYTMMRSVNGYLIKQDDDFTLVDVGVGSGFVDTLEKQMQANGHALTDIKHIIITHAHPDHCGGLADLQSRIDATTYAHPLDAPVITGEKDIPHADPATLGRVDRFLLNLSGNQPTGRVDQHIEEGQVLDFVHPGATVIHLPGHSDGQIGIWLPDEGTLTGGDVMMALPFGLSVPIKAVSPDWKAVKQSIRRVADMPIKTLCLGHGSPLTDDTKAKVTRFAYKVAPA